MRLAPRLSEVPKYPVIAGTALLATGVTIAWWSKTDISPLFDSAMIRRGEIWRLVTSVLPHADILHLLFNLYWVWAFGTLIEEVYGHFKTAALVLLFSLGPNAFEFGFASGGVGLSGVGYGLFGLLWILSQVDPRFEDAVDKRTVQLFVGWFFFCIVATYFHIMAIANIAHGMGAVFGILTGYAIVRRDLSPWITAAVAATLLFGLWAATLGRPRVNVAGDGGREEEFWGYRAMATGHRREAIRWFRDAVTYQPKNAGYWYDLSLAYRSVGDATSSLAAVRKSAELGEASAQYLLGAFYEQGDKGVPKDVNQALFWYRKAAEQDNPGALNNVAWTYATSSDPAIRNPKAALEYAKRAVSLTEKEPEPSFLDTLAEAYWLNDQAEEAVKVETQAIALAPPESKAEFQKQLEKFQSSVKKGAASTSKSF